MVEAEKGKYASPLNPREGWVCLDFANTALWHAREHPTERLKSYPDLVSWAERIGILTSSEAAHLLRRARRHREEATVVLKRAIALREVIYRIFSAMAHSQAPKAADLGALNEALAEALARSQIIPTADGFAWDWSGNVDELGRMLWAVARSAADLLTSETLRRVGECAAEDRGCGWLFLDKSRNRSRRWCAMKVCGNRAKVLRYYERRRDPSKKKSSAGKR